MEAVGLWMLAAVAALLVATGLPAFVVLIGVAVVAGGLGIALGVVPAGLALALPARLVGLLENDLLQALPLFGLMGAMLNRLPLAEALYRGFQGVFARAGAAPGLAALGLGTLLAPMNGSVGASVATLSHIVGPRLVARRVLGGDRLALVCVAATLGVLVPPSLVLILLGDAMMRAHTEAVNKTGATVRIINTQDVFHGALVPAALFIFGAALIIWWRGRNQKRETVAVSRGDWLTAIVTILFIGALLVGVAIGKFYAVEAAAMGAFGLFVFGLVSQSLRRAVLEQILADTAALTGALFALLVAATTFTLTFRAFGTDLLLDRWIGALPGGAGLAMTTVLGLIFACGFVLDAFEIIFVIVPVLLPPLLTRVPDAPWVAVATLLVLQASFLIPPFGYAVMMARGALADAVSARRALSALLPFLIMQVLVLGLVLARPALVHLFDAEVAATPALTDEQIRQRFQQLQLPADEDD